MSDRSPADVFADAIEADGLYVPQDALDVASAGLAALAAAGFLLVRPGDPWTAAAEWIDAKWPNQSIESRGLALAEEAGEVCRAILKRVDHSRGDPEHWTAEIRKECADVLAVLAHIALLEGFSLREAMDDWLARRAPADDVEDPTDG